MSSELIASDRLAKGTSRITRLAKAALWISATLILAICVLAAFLIFPGRPKDGHRLRFEGYIDLPKAKGAGLLTMLDYLTVSGDDLFVANVSSGGVYKVPLH